MTMPETRWQARIEHAVQEGRSVRALYVDAIEAVLLRDGHGAVSPDQLRMWQRDRLQAGRTIDVELLRRTRERSR